MKRFLIIISILMLFISSGCTTNNGYYFNVAYITEDFLTAEQKDMNQTTVNDMNTYTSGLYYMNNCNTTYYVRIKGFKYKSNNTILLELEDGRKMQTSVENVILMYDPDIN